MLLGSTRTSPSSAYNLASKRVYVVLVLLACLSYFSLRPQLYQNLAKPDSRAVNGSDSGVQADRLEAHQDTVDVQRSHDHTSLEEGWSWDQMADTAKQRFKETLAWQAKADANEKGSSHSEASTADSDSADDILSYRKHLEEAHSPYPYKKHSKTLTFDHIYVLSLKHRTDRRSRMTKIARALGLEFTFVDAMDKKSPVIGWIAERVKEIRAKKRPILAKALGLPPQSIGGLAVDSIWLKGKEKKLGLYFPDIRKSDKRWTLPSSNPESRFRVADGQEIVDWVTYLENTTDLSTLKPASVLSMADLNVPEFLHDPVELLDARQVNEGVISTWYSQTRVWKQMIENNDRSALILEDDTDIEWDIERIWPNVERALPEDWEIVYLGHCWGKELGKPQYIHPQLHRASEPRCLHGYALSQKGARHLFEVFSDPWRAYQTPVDTFVPYLIRESAAKRKDPEKPLISAFSMEPAVIIQSKDLASDIQTGVGSSWRGLLADSTWDRILRDEEQDVKQLKWEDTKDDPAIKPRPWGSWSTKKAETATLPSEHVDRQQGDVRTEETTPVEQELPILQIIEQPKVLVEEVDDDAEQEASSPARKPVIQKIRTEEAPKHRRAPSGSSEPSGQEDDSHDDSSSQSRMGRPHRSRRRKRLES